MKNLFLWGILILFTTPIFAQKWAAKSTGCVGIVYGIDYVSNSVIWISTASGEAALSTDAGLTWKKVTNPGTGSYSIAAFSEKIACVATGPTSGNGKIVRTTDGGVSWSQVYTKAGAWFNFIDNFDTSSVWALSDPVGGKYLIVKSFDRGATWTEIADPPAAPAIDVFGANDSFYRINRTAWFGVGGGGNATAANKVFKSAFVPEGPWTSANTTVQFTGSMAFSSEQGNGLVGFWSSGILNKTTDGGASYSAILGSRPDSVYAIDYVQGTSNCWLATSAGIFKSTNNGSTWTEETVTGAGSRSYFAVKIFGDINNALIGGEGGVVLKSLNSPILSVPVINNTTPVNFNLAQNFPNPFNPSTQISYQIPSDNFVSLRVYNSLGQLVSTLVNQVQVQGSYNMTFDASRLTSGVYYAVLKVGTSSEITKTIKMSLIK